MNNSNLQPEQNDDDYDYYCSTCNMKVGKYDKFCKNCGTELENEIVDYNEDANYSDNQNDEKGEPKYVLIKDKELSIIDGLPCKVASFQPIGAYVKPDGEVVSANSSIPYTSIELECE